MKKILFFINGPVPTEADKLEASEIVGKVVFRNANFAASEQPEPCDGVAGAVPENYKALFPVAGAEIPEPAESDKPKAKPGRKPKAEPEPIQTPLIPAENSWTPNA